MHPVDLTRHNGHRLFGRRQLITRSMVAGLGMSGSVAYAIAQDISPTHSSAPDHASASSGSAEQQFPCPPPTGPYDWLCGKGPFDPWYPVVAPPDITAATGIAWYGIQGLEAGGLVVAAFDNTADEVITYRSNRVGDRLGWSMGAAAATLEGQFDPPGVDGDTLRLGGMLNGTPFTAEIDAGGVVRSVDASTFRLNAGQQLLLTQWTPMFERLDALLELSLAAEVDPLESSDLGCFAAGYLFGISLPLCIIAPGAGCIPAGGATAYISNKCTDSW